MLNQKGFAPLLLVTLLLLAGIGIGIYLVQNPAIFKPKAAEEITTTPVITSWDQRSQLAPNLQEFTYRGAAQSEMGAAYAAPGTPENMKAMSSIIRYRDNSDAVRNYDLYLTPSLAIWKIVRYEADGQTSQYIGNFPSNTCFDGNLTMTDGVIQPAIGLDGNYGSDGGATNMMVRTNYGCMQDHYSVPYPIDNYQSAGSGRGILPELTQTPQWNQTSQTLSSTSVSVPWVYYEGLLDKNSPQFQGDFAKNYWNFDLIVNAAKDSLSNVSLNNQVTILPDGTIQLTHMWNALVKRPWMEHTTYSYWVPFDSIPTGKVIYYDKTNNQYVDPFATDPNPISFTTYGDRKIQDTGGWFGYFIDKHRPNFGIAFYTGYDIGMGGISVSPPYNPINPGGVPGIVTTHLFPKGYWDKIFYQTFLVIGTQEEMQQKSEILNKYVYNLAAPAPNSTSSPIPNTVNCALSGGVCVNNINKSADGKTCSQSLDLGPTGDCTGEYIYCFAANSCTVPSSSPSPSLCPIPTPPVCPSGSTILNNGTAACPIYACSSPSPSSSPVVIKKGDADKDGDVDVFDYGRLLQIYNGPSANYPQMEFCQTTGPLCDTTIIDWYDYGLWLHEYRRNN